MAQNFSNLTGKILIATPYAMEGNVFHKSMIYMIQHGEEGSVGLIFNRPINDMPEDTILKKVNESLTLPDIDLEVHIGGPLELERGFFLHTMDYNKNTLFKSADNIHGVTSNTEIIQDIKKGNGPDHALFILGYTGWGKGQLEFELENNLWIIAEPDPELIFSDNPLIKWDMGLASLGVLTNEFIPQVGNC